ncbi:MAG: DUF1344 domain-containing protein [Alphaproteobacteria bacterium]|nr:DUF1344 domain-containing protein [Alphaproteobacteria bacterium]
MKTALATMVGVVIATAAIAAIAAESKGTIEKIDPADRVLVLSSGETFTLAKNVMVETIKEGKTVVVVFDEKDGKKVASAVTEE